MIHARKKKEKYNTNDSCLLMLHLVDVGRLTDIVSSGTLAENIGTAQQTTQETAIGSRANATDGLINLLVTAVAIVFMIGVVLMVRVVVTTMMLARVRSSRDGSDEESDSEDSRELHF
ncbi:unnamed protein product [Mucor circinelloides]